MPSPYKPSPLGYGTSPRASPFRRRDSTATQPSPTRQTTPLSSPVKLSIADTPASTKAENNTTPAPAPGSGSIQPTVTWAPKVPQAGSDVVTKVASPAWSTRTVQLPDTMAAQGNKLSQLQPSQVRNLRDGFQILDRDSDGVVSREDVADMLNQLGNVHVPPLALYLLQPSPLSTEEGRPRWLQFLGRSPC
jgi:hypothetical protein